MEGSFETIASSLEALSQEYQTIAHNLANVNTVGYKRHCTAFTEELQAQTGDSSTADTGTIEPVLAIDYTQGALVQTGRKLDLALLGGGMLVVESEAGPLYTRNGALRVSTDGQLLNSAGQPVAGETGFITIPNTLSTSSVHIAPDGSVPSQAHLSPAQAPNRRVRRSLGTDLGWRKLLQRAGGGRTDGGHRHNGPAGISGGSQRRHCARARRADYGHQAV